MKANSSYLSSAVQVQAQVWRDGEVLETANFPLGDDGGAENWARAIVKFDKLRDGDNEERFIEL